MKPVGDCLNHNGAGRLGQCLKEEAARNSYNIYSSVTGQKITELTATGELGQTMVYLGGTKIARFDSEGVAFHVTDPMTGSEQQTADGTFDPESDQRIELAALGTNVPVTDPPSMPPPDPARGGYVGSPENGCIFVEASNSPIPCSDFDFPIREKLKKPKKKEALGIVLTRSKPSLPFADPPRGPDMALAASYASGEEPDPEPEPIEPEDPCPWDTDGTKDCAMTVINDGPSDPIGPLFDQRGGTVNDEWSLRSPKLPNPVRKAYAAWLNNGIAQDCVDALKRIGLWDKIVATAESVPVYDSHAEPLRSKQASRYFGPTFPGMAGKSVEQYVGNIARTFNTGRHPGIYAKGGLSSFDARANPMNHYWFLHENAHFVQNPSLNLDISLARLLGVVVRTGDNNESGALARYFYGACNPNQRGR